MCDYCTCKFYSFLVQDIYLIRIKGGLVQGHSVPVYTNMR